MRSNICYNLFAIMVVFNSSKLDNHPVNVEVQYVWLRIALMTGLQACGIEPRRDEMRVVCSNTGSYSLRATTCRVQTSDDRTIAHNSGGNGSHSWSGVSPVLRNRRPGGEIGRNETRRGFRRVVDLWETARSPGSGSLGGLGWDNHSI